jgi:hypothetical protein
MKLPVNKFDNQKEEENSFSGLGSEKFCVTAILAS